MRRTKLVVLGLLLAATAGCAGCGATTGPARPMSPGATKTPETLPAPAPTMPSGGGTYGATTPVRAAAQAPAGCSGSTVVVRSGDTLAALAPGRVAAAAAASGIANPDLIFPGQVVCVPAGSAPQVQVQSARIATGATTVSGPCAGMSFPWPSSITFWQTPPGCWSGVWFVDAASHTVGGRILPDWGWCETWPEWVRQDTGVLGRARTWRPSVGAVVVFAPGEQGASSVGHFALVEAIDPAGGWILVSEENNEWRGAGFSKLDYRFVRLTPGVSFIP